MAKIDEVAAGIYRIHTAVPPTVAPGGFSFNQYLILDEEPLLFHTGSRKMFPSVVEAVRRSSISRGSASSRSHTTNRTKMER